MCKLFRNVLYGGARDVRGNSGSFVRGREDTHDSEIIDPQTQISHTTSHVDKLSQQRCPYAQGWHRKYNTKVLPVAGS